MADAAMGAAPRGDAFLGGGGGGCGGSRGRDSDCSPERIWAMLNPVESEAVVNALRRWQCCFGFRSSVFARASPRAGLPGGRPLHPHSSASASASSRLSAASASGSSAASADSASTAAAAAAAVCGTAPGPPASFGAATSIADPYVRLILDRCLPPPLERRLCAEPLDGLLCAVIAVRTAVMDEALRRWAHGDGVLQLIIVASGFDTRAWRLRWPPGMRVFEVDSATVHAQKAAALGDIDAAAARTALVGGVYDLAAVLRRAAAVGYDPGRPTLWLVEDVVEYMLPAHASAMFATMAQHCAPGSRLIASLSDVKLRDLLRRYGHTAHLVEEYEPPGLVLNRIGAAGWHAEVILSGQLEERFDVDLHNCLYLVHGTRL